MLAVYKLHELSITKSSRLPTSLVLKHKFNIINSAYSKTDIFTVLHGMQTGYSDEKAVRLSGLSVCLSVKRVLCDKTEERPVQSSILYERSFSQVFWEEKWLVGATPSI